MKTIKVTNENEKVADWNEEKESYINHGNVMFK